MTPRQQMIENLALILANNGLHGMPMEDCIISVTQILDALESIPKKFLYYGL